MEYIKCLEILQLIKQAIKQESFERLKSDFHLLELKTARNENLYNLVIELKIKVEHHQKDVSSQLKKSYVRDAYGRVFRKTVELIQLSDIAQLEI